VGRPNDQILALCRVVFNSVALTPYTPLVENLVSLLVHLVELGHLARAQLIDLVSTMLRHLVRHLTAFDLVRFHNMGANYPDALVLDALLKTYLDLIEHHADRFLSFDSDGTGQTIGSLEGSTGGTPVAPEHGSCGTPVAPGNEDEIRGQSAVRRRRRRALRQAWIIRQHYQGHPVPEIPTSPGENVRVLPAPFVRVPEEQLTQPSKRPRRLFANGPSVLTPTTRAVLERSIGDLASPAELRELGMAVYLDRPLGACKQSGEVDRTPLVSYEAFSRAIAGRRLAELDRAGLLPAGQFEHFSDCLEQVAVAGVPVASFGTGERPGVVALEGARLASEDFLFLRTTRQSLDDLLAAFDMSGLEDRAPQVAAWLSTARNVLFIRRPEVDAPRGSLVAFAVDLRTDGTAQDSRVQPRIEFDIDFDWDRSTDADIAYVERAGVEYPRQGLRVQRVWEETQPGQHLEQREFDNVAVRLPVIPVRRLPD
jgi:hypothetical protein